MTNFTKSAAVLLLACVTSHGQTVVADNFNANSGTTRGFLPGEGVNFGINPPTTRLTGSAAPNLRYIATDATKLASNYRITGGQVVVAAATSSGRFTLSADGTTPYDFAPALGISAATALHPVVYDISISMANNSADNQRFSFALGTAENNANFWDFGIQLYRISGNNYYQIGKRIDRVSYTTATDSTGTTGDLNSSIIATAAGTFGSLLNITMRVTDAGAETTTFNSQVQLSLDGGSTWFYETEGDSSLTSGWRLDTANRYLMWDIAGSAAATYDNFSVTIVTPAIPEPSSLALGILAAIVLFFRRRR